MEETRRNPRQLYSVFVGHLQPETTKVDLLQLFSKFGNVGDMNIVETEKPFKYGFVRYADVESAAQAVRELNKWVLNGSPIIVDFSNDTREIIAKGVYKIKDGKHLHYNLSSAGSCEIFTFLVGPLNNGSVVAVYNLTQMLPPVGIVHMKKAEKLEVSDLLLSKKKEPKTGKEVPMVKPTRDYINDVMYLSRVKETCAALNFEVSRQNVGLAAKDDQILQPLDISKVLEQLSEANKGRPKTIAGKVSENSGLESTKEKLLTSDDVPVNEAKLRADTFMSVTNKIMQTISTFLANTNVEGKKKQEVEDPSVEGSTNKRLEVIPRPSQDVYTDINQTSLSQIDSAPFSLNDSSGLDILSSSSHSDGGCTLKVKSPVKLSEVPDSTFPRNDIDSDSSSFTSDDVDHLNGDSGVELDTSLKNNFQKTEMGNSRNLFSRQYSDEMPSLEFKDDEMPQLESSEQIFKNVEPPPSFSLNELESDLAFQKSESFSDQTADEFSLLQTNLSASGKGNTLKRQNKSDGDLIYKRQNTLQPNSEDASEVPNNNLMDWVFSKLKQSESKTYDNDNKPGGLWSARSTMENSASESAVSDESASSCPREKLMTSSQFQSYYNRAILGRGRGTTQQQSEPPWIRGGRWGGGPRMSARPRFK